MDMKSVLSNDKVENNIPFLIHVMSQVDANHQVSILPLVSDLLFQKENYYICWDFGASVISLKFGTRLNYIYWLLCKFLIG